MDVDKSAAGRRTIQIPAILADLLRKKKREYNMKRLASGDGNFPIFDQGDEVVYISSDETRQIMTDYVKEKGTIDISSDNNGKLKNVQTQGTVRFLL